MLRRARREKSNDVIETAVTLQDAFEFTPRGLVVHGAPGIDEWLRRILELRNAQDALLWCLGDMLNYGEARYGEKYAQAAEDTGYDPDYLRNVAYVARQFDLSLRSDKLRWSHHRALAAQWIKSEDRARIIAEAEQDRLTVNEIRACVRMLPYAPPLPTRARPVAAEPRVVDLNAGIGDAQAAHEPAASSGAVLPPLPNDTTVTVSADEITDTLTGVFARHQRGDIEANEDDVDIDCAPAGVLVRRQCSRDEADEGETAYLPTPAPLPPPLPALRATVEACYGRQVVLVFDEAPELHDGQRLTIYISTEKTEKEGKHERSSNRRKA